MTMAHSLSPATGKRYGILRVCRLWDITRSSFYARQHTGSLPVANKRGPKSRYTDDALLNSIKIDLERSPFIGEGHRKVHARLRILDNIRVGPKRILGIMRKNGLLSPYRSPQRPAKGHTGTIVTDKPNEMWATDGTKVFTVDDGNVWIFPVLDHFNSECVGCHVSKYGSRFAALEPIKQGLEQYCGGVSKQCAQGISLRMDHGSQYISNHFRHETQYWGFNLSYAFLAEPETNGIAERFMGTMKQQIIYGRVYQNIKELTDAVNEFKYTYNNYWRLEKLGYMTPVEARKNYFLTRAA